MLCDNNDLSEHCCFYLQGDGEDEDKTCFGSDDSPLPHGVESRTLLTGFGKGPESGKELKDWSKAKQEKPIPIKFELTPVVNLFTSENLEPLNINATNITSWFLPLYVRYCKVSVLLYTSI